MCRDNGDGRLAAAWIMGTILLATAGLAGAAPTVIEDSVHGVSLEGNLMEYEADRTVWVYLPPGYRDSAERYPVIYSLHPADGSAGRHAGLFLVLDSLITAGITSPMLVVAPVVPNWSMYMNSSVTGNWEDFVTHEVVAHVDATYRTLPHAAARGITGFSMGGGGSMHLAMEHPGVFGAVYSRSPGGIGVEPIYANEANRPRVLRAYVPDPGNPPDYYEPLFEEVEGEERLVAATWEHFTARTALGRFDQFADSLATLRAIRLDVGSADGFRHIPPGSRAFSAALEAHGIAHTFVEYDGDHGSHEWLLTQTVTPHFFHDALDFVSLPSQLAQVRRATPQFVRMPEERMATLDVEIALAPEQVNARLDLDLSGVGGSDRVALIHQSKGVYRTTATITPVSNGHTDLPIWMTPSTGAPFVLHFISVAVWPLGDIVILDDGIGQDWQATSTGGAEPPMISNDLPPVSGDAVVAVSVAPASFIGWKLGLEPQMPIYDVGYAALEFWFHPGSASGRALSFRVNTFSTGLHDDEDGIGVDLGLSEWQHVVIPVGDLPVGWPLEEIQFNGDLEGTFYIDDLRLVAADGAPAVVTAVKERQEEATPQAFALAQNYPNPFNSGTVIGLALPTVADVEVAVYNLAGQKVATLFDGLLSGGEHAVRWDGRDDGGRALASGMYLYRLQGGDRVKARKLLLLQ